MNFEAPYFFLTKVMKITETVQTEHVCAFGMHNMLHVILFFNEIS